MDAIPVIRERLAALDNPRGDPYEGGRRAALWRAQQQAAKLDCTLDDLRRYCLDRLSAHRLLSDEPSEYLRGYRAELQTVLAHVRRLERD